MHAYPKLVEFATDQHGLVARAQALEAGISASTIDRYLAQGLLEPMARGIYHVPATRTDYLTRFQKGVLRAGEGAVISGASVLDMLELCDILPKRMEVTIPKRSRRGRGCGPDSANYEIRHEDIPAEDITVEDGVPMVRPRRAIVDAALSGADPYQIGLAIRTAGETGRVTKREYKRLQRWHRERSRPKQAVPEQGLLEPVDDAAVAGDPVAVGA